MINKTCFIYPYYNNPKMLEMQADNWSRMSDEFKTMVSIFVIDDHSHKSCNPVPILTKCRARVECHRLAARWPWNQHQCRNIGAKLAGRMGDNPWLFMSDIDIMLTPEHAETMLNYDLDPFWHYTMNRVFAPEFLYKKVHPNTFLVKHNLFWKVNGYDLDLAPIGGGGYGGDGVFMRQLGAISPKYHMDDVELIGYGRSEKDGEPVIPDADTRDLDRDEWAGKYMIALNRKKRAGDLISENPIRISYERTL